MIFLVFILNLTIKAQNNLYFDKFITPEQIVTKLYGGVWDTSRKACAWVPDIETRCNLRASWWVLDYTSEEDTVFTVPIKQFSYKSAKHQHFVIITNTYGSLEGGRGCGVSWGLIELILPFDEKEKYKGRKLLKFKKHVGSYGNFGVSDWINLIYLGKGSYVIEEVTSDTPQGILYEYTRYYFNGNIILELESANDPRMELSISDYFYTKRQVDTTQQKIFLHTEGTEYDYKQRKMLTIDKKITIGFGKEGTFRVLGD